MGYWLYKCRGFLRKMQLRRRKTVPRPPGLALLVRARGNGVPVGVGFLEKGRRREVRSAQADAGLLGKGCVKGKRVNLRRTPAGSAGKGPSGRQGPSGEKRPPKIRAPGTPLPLAAQQQAAGTEPAVNQHITKCFPHQPVRKTFHKALIIKYIRASR